MRYARSATCGVRRPSFLQSSSVAAACAAAAAMQNSPQNFACGALPRRPMAAPLSLDAVSKIVRPGALRHCKDAGQNLAYPPTSLARVGVHAGARCQHQHVRPHVPGPAFLEPNSYPIHARQRADIIILSHPCTPAFALRVRDAAALLVHNINNAPLSDLRYSISASHRAGIRAAAGSTLSSRY